MYFDEDGRSTPDGAFQMINGKLVLRDGGVAHFSIMAMDSRADTAPCQAFLRDAAGKPVTLIDRDRGHRVMALDDIAIMAIEDEAKRHNRSVESYVRDVLRAVPASH